jgi:hypothetical protein
MLYKKHLSIGEKLFKDKIKLNILEVLEKFQALMNIFNKQNLKKNILKMKNQSLKEMMLLKKQI